MEKKEALVADFLFRFLQHEEIPFYKIVYFLRMCDVEGNIHTILHQVTTLRVYESGKVEHVFGVHTDVSHLSLAKTDKISLISINSGKSYYALDPEHRIVLILKIIA